MPTSKQIWVTLKPSSVFHAHPSALAIFKIFSLWMATNPRPSCDGKKPEVSHDHKPFTGAPQHWRLHVRGLYSDDEVDNPMLHRFYNNQPMISVAPSRPFPWQRGSDAELRRFRSIVRQHCGAALKSMVLATERALHHGHPALTRML